MTGAGDLERQRTLVVDQPGGIESGSLSWYL